MKIEEAIISLIYPDGTSKETIRSFLQRRLDELEEPEHVPEVWDVYRGVNTDCILTPDGKCIIIGDDGSTCACDGDSIHDRFADNPSYTFVGKFSERYIRADKLIKALSVEDGYGDSVLLSADGHCGAVDVDAIQVTREALAELSPALKKAMENPE